MAYELVLNLIVDYMSATDSKRDIALIIALVSLSKGGVAFVAVSSRR